MPSVGTAYVSIRVNTKSFTTSLDSVMKRLSKQMEAAGTSMGKDFEKGLKKTNFDSVFKPLTDASDKAKTQVVNNNLAMERSAGRAGKNISAALAAGGEGAKKLEGDVKGARSAVGGLGQDASRAKRSLSGIGGGGGLRSGANDAGFFSSMLKDLTGSADSNVSMLRHLYDTAAFGGTALAGLVAGLSAAAQGIFAIGANAAAAAPALGVFASGLLGLAQVGGVVALAMKGVGAALTAGFKAVDAPAKSAAKATDGIAKAVKAAARGVRDAKEALQDAYRAAARAAEEAARRTREAEQNLASAQRETLIAQRNLNAARKEGLEQLEDIAFAAEDAALAEQRASLDLEDAYNQLLAVSELAPDNRARVEAELAFKEAELNLRQSKDAREDADKAQKQAAKSGVEGTDAMIDARNQLADAQEREADAAKELADARRNEAQVAEDNARRIRDALQGLADAQDRLRDAHKGTGAAATAAAKAQDAFALAMAKLGPNQREFVNRILGMREGFQKFRNAIAEPLFGRLNSALDVVNKKGKDGKSIQDVLQTGLIGTSKALGDTAIQAANLANQDVFQKSLGDAMEANNTSIRNFGSAGVHLADAFITIADAAAPLLQDFSRYVNVLTRGWAQTLRTKNATGELTQTINTGGQRVKEFWGLAQQLGRTLFILGRAANRAANGFGDINSQSGQAKGFIPTLTESLDDFNDKLDKNPDLVDRFSGALSNLVSIGNAVGAITKPFIDMGSDPKVGEAFDIISKSDAFERLGDTATDALPDLAEMTVHILDIVAAMSESGSISRFLDIMERATDVVADLVTTMTEDHPDLFKFIAIITASAAAARLLWGGFKLATSPLVKLGTGIKNTGKRFSDFVNKQPGETGKFKKAWKSGFEAVGRFSTNTYRTMRNGISRVGNVFKSVSNKILRTKFRPTDILRKEEKVPKTDVKDEAQEAKAKAAGTDLAGEFAKGLKAGKPLIDAAMEAIEAQVKLGFIEIGKTVGPTAVKIGKDLMSGLSRGIRTGSTEARAAALKAGRDVADDVGDGAGTHSPSTITLKDGNDIMEGLELGIKSGTAEAKLAAMKAGATVGNSVGNSAKTAAATSSAGIGNAMGSSAAGSKGVGKLGKAMGPLKLVAKGLGGAMTLAMGPFGIILELLPLLIPLFIMIEKKTGIFSKALKVLTDAASWLWNNVLKPFFGWLMDIGGKAIEQITDAFQPFIDMIGTVGDKISWFFGWLRKKWPLILAILGGPFGLLVLLIIRKWDKIVAFFRKAPGKIKRILAKIWQPISDKLEEARTNVVRRWTKFMSMFNKWKSDVKDKLGKIFKPFTDALSNAWTNIKNKWEDIKAAVKKWPGQIGDRIRGMWKGLSNGFKNVYNDVADLVNDRLIGGINNILGVLHVKKITFRMPKYAEGGPVFGPGGPKSDRIIAALSNGEYVLPTKAAKAIGPQNLEYMRRTGKLPEEGTGGLFGAIGNAFSTVADAVQHGAEAALKWILNAVTDNLPGGLLGNILGGMLKVMSGDVVAYGKKKDDDAAAAAAAAAGGGAAYTGPPGGWTYPLAHRYVITQYPNSGHSPPWSVDIGAPMGTAVRAASKGYANHYSLGNRSYGNYVVISHAHGQQTLYAHLRSFSIKNGQTVKTGQLLGYSDSTGNSTGPHLHFELKPSSSTIRAMAAHGVRLAQGGVVAPSTSGTLALLAEAGQHERVTPLDREGFTPAERKIIETLEAKMGGGGGDTFHVHPSERMDEARLADLVARRVAWKRRRGTGR